MATRAEILKTLNSLQNKNFKKIIEISKEQVIVRRVQMERLQLFTINRANRIESLVGAVDTKLEEDAVLDEYTTFQNTSQSISGKATDLDEMMGIIHQTLYGDVKRTKLRQRELNELSFTENQINNFVKDLKTLESDLDKLSTDLDTAAPA